ncbi:Uncharacterised protein [Mycobacterium tuberculosis]|nr:Uncharacterised protein [Mycobacterium tuberculosis]
MQFGENLLDQCLNLGLNLHYFQLLVLYLHFHLLPDGIHEITAVLKGMILIHQHHFAFDQSPQTSLPLSDLLYLFIGHAP